MAKTKEFTKTNTYMHCRKCDNTVTCCDHCSIPFIDDEDIYCSEDEHRCLECLGDFGDDEQ